MKAKITFYTGILGAFLFVVSAIVGGILIENYSLTSQYISESYASNTQYGKALRFLGYIPSGILLTIFSFNALKHFQPSKLTKIGFIGIAIFYGLGTITVGLFPCDSGCNKEFINPSFSQIIHNSVGLFTYIFVPISIITIGIGLKYQSNYKKLSKRAILYGMVSILFVFILFLNPNSKYIGLYQRFIETIFILWIIACAIAIKKNS